MNTKKRLPDTEKSGKKNYVIPETLFIGVSRNGRDCNFKRQKRSYRFAGQLYRLGRGCAMKNFFALKNKVLTLLVISLSFVVLAFTFSLPIGVRAETAEITDYSVTLEKDIKLNYFVKCVTDSAYMTFSIDGSEPMTVTEKTATETGYKFTFNGITPQLVGKEYTR